MQYGSTSKTATFKPFQVLIAGFKEDCYFFLEFIFAGAVPGKNKCGAIRSAPPPPKPSVSSHFRCYKQVTRTQLQSRLEGRDCNCLSLQSRMYILKSRSFLSTCFEETSISLQSLQFLRIPSNLGPQAEILWDSRVFEGIRREMR